MKKLCVIMLMLLALESVISAQTFGLYTAKGTGKGETRESAIEAAQLDAINTMVFTVLHRDALYRDLFTDEALRNGRITNQEIQKNPLGSWQVSLTLEIDEGLAEGLYVGRYSTTLTALLDQAE